MSVILQSIVQQTIDFADQKDKSFQFCIEELMACIKAMGLLRLPQICDNWSKRNVLSTPFLPAILSQDQFQNIL